MYKKGQRVESLGTDSGVPKGLKGTILENTEMVTFIEFDSFIGGHSARGLGRS